MIGKIAVSSAIYGIDKPYDYRIPAEMEQSKLYDYIVVNDQVEACAENLLNIIAQGAQ